MNPAPDLTAWLNDCLDEHERIARAAAEKAQPPWRNTNGLVRHSGPSESGMGRDDGLWDDEGTSGMDVDHRLCMWGVVADHVALHDPASVLADIAAKRWIIDRVLEDAAIAADPLRSQRCTDTEWQLVTMARDVLRSLASAYAHRPGYMPEWAPEAGSGESPHRVGPDNDEETRDG